VVHLSRNKWPEVLVNWDFGRLSESYLIIFHGLGEVQRLMSSQVMSHVLSGRATERPPVTQYPSF